MGEAPQRVIKRRIVMADGRYLIFYDFAPPDGKCSSLTPVPTESTSVKPAGAKPKPGEI